MSMTLDEIFVAQAELDAFKRKIQQQARIRQMNADMASEIERIKAEDWQPPFDVDAVYMPETPAPLDWFIRGQIEKAAKDETLADIVKPWFEIEDTD